MIKIYDCSLNNFFKEKFKYHILNRETEFFKNIKINSYKYGYQFISDCKKADLILTNTCIPNTCKISSPFKIPIIHKVEGFSWKNDVISKSIQKADLSIFNSKYSLSEFNLKYHFNTNNEILYDNIDDVKNIVKTNFRTGNFIFYTKNWTDDKLKLIKHFSKICRNRDNIILVGNEYIDNITTIIPPTTKTDWIDLLSKSKAIVILDENEENIQFILQAMKSKIPIIYKSGGIVEEYVGENGIKIRNDRFDEEEFESVYMDFNNFKNNISYKTLDSTIIEFYSILNKFLKK